MTQRINFTRAALDALPLPPEGKRMQIHDTRVKGLQLRITSQGVKTFVVFRRIKGGRPQRVTLGRYPTLTIDQARRKAEKVNDLLVQGSFVSPKKQRALNELTLGELFEDFIKNRRNRRGSYLSPRTTATYQGTFKNHVLPLANRKLSEIRHEQIATLHVRVGREHPSEANRVVALISSLFAYAQEQRVFSAVNPAQGIRKFPETSRERFLQADELPRFFTALGDEPNGDVRDYLLVSLLTGARRSNVLGMRWEDVHLERAEWRLTHTKNGLPQTVVLTPDVIDLLRQRRDNINSTFVFPSESQSGHLVEPKRAWKRILTRAGIQNLRLHDLRRTLGSWQAKTGASLPIIGKSLNHASHQSTQIYARLDMDPVRDSVGRAVDAMLEAANKTESPTDDTTKKPSLLPFKRAESA